MVMTEYNVKLKRARKSSWPVKWHITVNVGQPFQEGYRNVLFDGSLTMWGAKRKIQKAIKEDKKPKVEFNYKIEG